MSKCAQSFPAIFLVILMQAIAAGTVFGQDLEISLKIDSANSILDVRGKLAEKARFENLRSVSIGKSVGDAAVRGLTGFDLDGQIVNARPLQPGEFLFNDDFSEFSYSIKLPEPDDPLRKANISWIARDKALLMLRDILPALEHADGTPVSALVKLDVPGDWIKTLSGDVPTQNFLFDDISRSIITAGKNWQTLDFENDSMAMSISIEGEFLYSMREAAAFSSSIAEGYRSIFGKLSNAAKIKVVLIKAKDLTGRWNAETVGNTAIIVSGDMTFKKPSLQRLHEQLRHEILHFWIPNDLALSGDYSWFYEGFAVYQSLKSALAENRISFDDYLSTLADAAYIASAGNQREALVGTSNGRLSGTKRYAESLLIAFLCDAAMLEKSRGKRSVTDVIIGFYLKHRRGSGEFAEGSPAAVSFLKSYPELNPIVDRYITGDQRIVLDQGLQVFGIEAGGKSTSGRFFVKEKLTGRQKDLLNNLGYNNWRIVRNDPK